MAQVQENIIDYLKREFRGFDEAPITDVDSLVLACLSYFRLPEETRGAALGAACRFMRSSAPTGLTG